MSLRYDEIVREWQEDEELFLEDFEAMMEQEEWRNYDFSETMDPNMDFMSLDEACQKCIFRQISKYKDTPDSTGKPMGNRFAVPCTGIPKQYISDEMFDYLGVDRDSEEGRSLEATRNPIAWAMQYCIGEDNQPWVPREYQKVMIACTSKRAVYRCGRRIGKSVALSVFILFYALLQPLYEMDPVTKKLKLDKDGNVIQRKLKIICIAPYEEHVKELSSRIKGFIDRSPILADSLERFTKKPFTFKFKNGSEVVCITAGLGSANEGLAIRGKDADIVVMDEGNYVGPATMKATNALMMTHAHSMLRISSTPVGAQDFFWKMCNANVKYKDFHFPSVCLPQWELQKSIIYSEVSTEDEFLHEYMAMFSASATGVFRMNLVEAAKKGYSYSECIRDDSKEYCIGVDWNTNAGTEIFVTEVDPLTGHFKAVQAENVPKSNWTQLSAIEKLIDLIVYWKPKVVCVDEGHGNGAIEVLRRYSIEHGDENKDIWNIRNTLLTYNFGSKIEAVDPITGQPRKKPAKPFLVQNAVRKFEELKISLSYKDEILLEQLANYEIVSVSSIGMPIYKPGKAGLGDHRLDAFMLSLVGWKLKFGHIDRRHYFVSGSLFLEQDKIEAPQQRVFLSNEKDDSAAGAFPKIPSRNINVKGPRSTRERINAKTLQNRKRR